MTTLQKLQVRQSEIRESINALLGNDSRSEEEDKSTPIHCTARRRNATPND